MADASPDSRAVGAATAKYDGFISYSHAADASLAPSLQRALHALARPWYRLRSLHVFRDETSLAANPALWPSIERALSASRCFIYLASPRAAASIWVQREVDWWLTHRGASNMLVVLTDGTLRWDEGAGDFDWSATNVLPPALKGRFRAEPLWVDLTWATRAEVRTLRHAAFRAAVLRLAAAIHGRDPEELDGEDLRVYRRNRLTARAGVAALIGLTVASIVAAFIAITRSRESTSRELASYSVQQLDTDPELSLRLAMHAVDSAATRQAEEALRRALSESQVLNTAHVGAQVSRVESAPSGDELLMVAGRDAWLLGPAKEIRLPHPALVSDAEFSRDGTVVATAGWDGKARVWNAGTGALVAEVQAVRSEKDQPGVGRIVDEARLSPGGTILVTRGGDLDSEDERQAKVWDVKSGGEVSVLRHSRKVHAVAVSPDDTTVATGDWDGTVRVWDATTGALRGTLLGHSGPVTALRFSPDGTSLVSGSADLTARRWETSTGRSLGVSGTNTTERVGLSPTRLVVLSPSARRALVHDPSSTVVYDTETSKAVQILTDFPGACQRAVFSADERLVACPGSDGVAYVWNVESGRRMATLRGHRGDLNDVTIHPNSEVATTAGSDGTARRWTLKPRSSRRRARGAHDQCQHRDVVSRRRARRHGKLGRNRTRLGCAGGAAGRGDQAANSGRPAGESQSGGVFVG